MENTINALIFVAEVVAAVYAKYTRTEASSKREQKSNDIFTFCMPCITALALGILLIDFYYLPIVITAALFAGTFALLISWTSEEKARQRAKRDAIEKTVKKSLRDLQSMIDRSCHETKMEEIYAERYPAAWLEAQIDTSLCMTKDDY